MLKHIELRTFTFRRQINASRVAHSHGAFPGYVVCVRNIITFSLKTGTHVRPACHTTMFIGCALEVNPNFLNLDRAVEMEFSVESLAGPVPGLLIVVTKY